MSSSTYQSQTARIALAGTQGVTYLDNKGKRVSFTGVATLNVTRNHKGERKSVTLVPRGERKAVARVQVDQVLSLISPSPQDRAAFLSHKG